MLPLFLLRFILFFTIFTPLLVQAGHTSKYSPKKSSKNDFKHKSHHKSSSNKSLQLPTYKTPSTSTNPTDVFCKSFVKQCYHEALHGKRGEVKVEIACERQGGKYSPNYAFACKADGQDLTRQVLTEVGSDNVITITTQGSTKVISDFTTDFTTIYSSTTQDIDLTTTKDVYDNQTTTTESIELTTKSITITSTTLIPITATTTSISTVVTTSPVTTTVTTSTATSITYANVGFPVMDVVFKTVAGRKRVVNQIDQSQFCSSYNSGCQQECNRVNSTPKHIICHSKSLYHYSLTCYCSNGKIETQHALEAAAEQENIVSISTISTSTSYGTITSTIVIPTTILSTSYTTQISHIPITATYTSLSTATQTSTIVSFTGSPTTVATSTPVSTVTNTVTTTLSATKTTTQTIIAPTGIIQATDANGFIKGYVQAVPFYGVVIVAPGVSSATVFAAILDSNSGLYQLSLIDGSGDVLIGKESSSSVDFISFQSSLPSTCGTAGQQAGPADEDDNCETFIIGPQSGGQSQLNLIYYSPLNNNQRTFYNWVTNSINGNPAFLYGVDDFNSFASTYGGQTTEVGLQFISSS